MPSPVGEGQTDTPIITAIWVTKLTHLLGFVRYNEFTSASVDVTRGPTFVKWESAFPLWLDVVARAWNNRKPV